MEIGETIVFTLVFGVLYFIGSLIWGVIKNTHETNKSLKNYTKTVMKSEGAERIRLLTMVDGALVFQQWFGDTELADFGALRSSVDKAYMLICDKFYRVVENISIRMQNGAISDVMKNLARKMPLEKELKKLIENRIFALAFVIELAAVADCADKEIAKNKLFKFVRESNIGEIYKTEIIKMMKKFLSYRKDTLYGLYTEFDDQKLMESRQLVATKELEEMATGLLNEDLGNSLEGMLVCGAMRKAIDLAYDRLEPTDEVIEGIKKADLIR